MFGKDEFLRNMRLRKSLKETLSIELAMRRANIEDTKLMKALAEYIKIKIMEDENDTQR